MEYQFRPIEQWPGERTRHPKRSRFRTLWSETLQLLERELRQLSARRIVIQADVDEGDVRLDGMLRANARPRSAAVILSFESKHGPLSYPCDTFDDWQDNVRAIAMSLEALRSVERYGVTRRAEQYRGWQSLPPPNGDHWTVDDARRFIESVLGNGRLDWGREPYQSNAIRNAEFKTHPDRGGNPDEFKKVQRARELILG